MNKEIKYFARKCDNCNKGMNEGYCGGDGLSYACSDKCLYVDGYTKELFKEDYKSGDIYWTEWGEDFEGNTEDGYYTKDGIFIESEEDIMNNWIS
tara:strand:+ start:351 stop:635 length:285 start_codon:yes stop_codon:yes gene_type:complete